MTATDAMSHLFSQKELKMNQMNQMNSVDARALTSDQIDEPFARLKAIQDKLDVIKNKHKKRQMEEQPIELMVGERMHEVQDAIIRCRLVELVYEKKLLETQAALDVARYKLMGYRSLKLASEKTTHDAQDTVADTDDCFPGYNSKYRDIGRALHLMEPGGLIYFSALNP